MFDEYSEVCGTCKYSRDDVMGHSSCVKARIVKVSPEGAKLYRDVATDEALRDFRRENGGKCPHYRKSLICKICEFFINNKEDNNE